MVTQSNNLNFTPGQISPRVNVSQYDKKSRTLTFSLYNGSQPFNISNGMAVTIEGTKPDNTGFQYAMIATAGSNVVSISIEQQMTVIAGDVPCEIVVSNAGKRLASANFILVVEPAALNENTIISETELPLIEEAAELAENIAIYVTTIHEDALKAEGYAVGKQNGVDVGSGSVYFHNNAKYHNEQAAISATNASNSATAASTAASTATTKASEATSAASTATSKASEATTAAQTATTKASEASASAQTAQEAAESLIGEVVDSEPYVLRQGLGNLADMALVGGSVTWNQLVQNGNFADTSGWSHPAGSITASNNILSFTLTENKNYASIFRDNVVNGKENHVILASAEILAPRAVTVDFYIGQVTSASKILTANVKTKLERVVKLRSDFSNNGFYIDVNKDGALAINDVVQISNVNGFDLTQMFGSTIADYIYSLEQATAGAGVAWFRKYFPNVYYGYQSAKIESVNVASRKVVGFNVWDEVWESGGIYSTSGENAEIATKIRSKNYIPILPSTVYYYKHSSTQSDLFFYDKDKNYLSYASKNTSGAFTTPSNAYYVRFSILQTSYSKGICINISKTTGTPKNGDYEPYQSSEYAFDSSKQLRGIPKLVDNKLSYDGDIYKAVGSITRKYGIVDLGTLNWIYQSDIQRFDSTGLQNVIKSNTNNLKANIITSKYLAIDANSCRLPNDKTCAVSANKNILIYDSAYSDAATFKTAMSGVYLVYELATPTTESANPYQNPQRAFIDGTEEFIDAGVTAGTRDVSIPVGNNTTYQLNETLPPIEDYVDGALKFKAAISALGTDESGRTTASRAYTTGEFFYKDGKMYKVLTSIAQGATFTINTNCQQTTLFAELKALAQ